MTWSGSRELGRCLHPPVCTVSSTFVDIGYDLLTKKYFQNIGYQKVLVSYSRYTYVCRHTCGRERKRVCFDKFVCSGCAVARVSAQRSDAEFLLWPLWIYLSAEASTITAAQLSLKVDMSTYRIGFQVSFLASWDYGGLPARGGGAGGQLWIASHIEQPQREDRVTYLSSLIWLMQTAQNPCLLLESSGEGEPKRIGREFVPKQGFFFFSLSFSRSRFPSMCVCLSLFTLTKTRKYPIEAALISRLERAFEKVWFWRGFLDLSSVGRNVSCIDFHAP